MYGGIKNILEEVQMPQTYGGVNSMPPKCKTYMPPKKIRKKTKAKLLHLH